MSLLADIAEDLNSYPGVLATLDNGEINVALPYENYMITLDDYDFEDEDDEGTIGTQSMSTDYDRPEIINDHATLLDAMLSFMAHSTYRTSVTGLTTDGDHHDCEAIFDFNGNPTILKVRS